LNGDYSRFSFDPRRNYSGVLQQQGRALLDQDWNEQSEIAGRRLRAALADAVGRVFVATAGAFKIESDGRGGLTIRRGRIYVDGPLAENHGAGREVPAFSKRGRGKLKDGSAARRSIPSTCARGEEGTTAYPAPPKIRAAQRWLFHNFISKRRSRQRF
jgi:hypothetical protein